MKQQGEKWCNSEGREKEVEEDTKNIMTWWCFAVATSPRMATSTSPVPHRAIPMRMPTSVK